jgi:hypothetical protein
MNLEIPLEERAVARESFKQLVDRLSRQSVKKHFDAYEDVAWDSPEFAIDPADPRFELPDTTPLGATAWYRAQPQPVRARIGLDLLARSMKVGMEFENVLSRGLLTFAVFQPNGSPEYRYAMHEVIEESQHSLMFQEFVNRVGRFGLEPPGIRGWKWRVSHQIVRLGHLFPELFFVFVLGGEDPIDHVQRTAIAQGRNLHPLVRRISQIHITEEARHLCFARQYLREHVPSLPPWKRAVLSVAAPTILFLMARLMLEPSRGVIHEYKIPREVIDEAYRHNPKHRAAVAESLGKVRELCEELGIVGPRSQRLWQRFGIAS